jgi:molecular chaperone DnaJ
MDHYGLLGVTRNATPDEIQKAYRIKAKQHHPDMHQESEKAKHAEIFKQIAEAFETLHDLSKRARYDLQFPKESPPGAPSKRTKTKEDFEAERKKNDKKPQSRYKHEPMHVHCSFFGGGSTGRNILVHLKLKPNEMKHGGSKSVTIKRRDICELCQGDGWGIFVCSKCKNIDQLKWICNTCNGSGTSDGKCPRCNGDGLGLWMLDEVIFNISANVQPGHTINILGQGEPAPGKAPGSVRVIII